MITKACTNKFNKKITYLVVKRCFDFVVAFIASIILIIPITVIALIVMIKDPGSPFYSHTRVGRYGREIKVVKIRSMKIGADKLNDILTTEQLVEYKMDYKIADDPRLIGYKKTGDGSTCFGAKLRKSKLDELPQIPINILLKGNMSFVGPRPILREELEEKYDKKDQLKMLSCQPGLTGYWQAYASNTDGYATGKRQRMEIYYIDHASIGLDIKILFKTVKLFLTRKE